MACLHYVRGPAVLMVIVFLGCDSGHRGDPATRFLLARAEAGHEAAQAALARGENPLPYCVPVDTASRELKGEVRRYQSWCQKDAPLAWGAKLVERLVAAKGKGADETAMADDCFDLERALDWVDRENADDPQVKALHGKRKILCP